jgi:hypothetical protein
MLCACSLHIRLRPARRTVLAAFPVSPATQQAPSVRGVVERVGDTPLPQLACDWIPAHLAVSRRNFSDCGFFWGPTMKPLHDLFAFSLVAISLLGSLPTHASPIVGGWYGTHLGQADSTAVITFLADGSYWMAEDGSSVLDPSGQDGMERGTYTWNPLTSAFSSTTLVDTSGQWGLSHSGLTSIGISGDTMTIDVGVTLNRVTSPTSAIVGSWYATPNAPNLARHCHNSISKQRNGLRAWKAPGRIRIPLIRM